MNISIFGQLDTGETFSFHNLSRDEEGVDETKSEDRGAKRKKIDRPDGHWIIAPATL